MQIERELKLDFDDVYIRPKRSPMKSREHVDLRRQFLFKHSKMKWSGIPIMCSNMDTVGTFQMANKMTEFNMFAIIHKHYSYKEWDEAHLPMMMAAPSIGANEADLTKFENLHRIHHFNFLCIDVANGYGEWFPEFISRVRGMYPDLTIMAGNVATREMTEQLILAGADVVKVGIGPGSVCTTRDVTGVGYPQLSAIIECADAAHGLDAHIIADGGCKKGADIAKAFGAGADFVMLGGMLAGHYECYPPDQIHSILLDNGGRLPFYGMSSETANIKYNGGLKDYRAAEGKETLIEFKGVVEDTLKKIMGGLKSTCTMVGAPTLKQLSKCTTFILVNR
jgi:GMP reductase